MDDEELEELYLTWKSEVLKELRPFLVDNLEPQKLFAYLRSCQVLDSDDQEDIEAERTRRRKNERLLDHIKNRGADGFDNLCEAIRKNTTQLFILRKILNLFQKKKDNCTELTINGQNTPPSEDYQVLLPVPGGPGGPVVPPFETPEENIAAVGSCEQDRRPRSPPPAYTEY